MDPSVVDIHTDIHILFAPYACSLNTYDPPKSNQTNILNMQ